MSSLLEQTKQIWRHMKRRCLDPKDRRWKDYGGRGITIDPSWMDVNKFIEDMGLRPPGFQLDRRDNDKGYCKENCRWATRLEQQNNMRTNRWVEFGGKRQTVSQWARELGIHHVTLRHRLQTMPLEEAMQKGRLSYFRRRASQALVVKCRWCGFERAVTRRGKYCYQCRRSEDGTNYRIVRDRRLGIKPKKFMELTPEEVAKFSGKRKVCVRCHKRKEIIKGFGLRRNLDARTKRIYSMPRVYCRTCDVDYKRTRLK